MKSRALTTALATPARTTTEFFFGLDQLATSSATARRAIFPQLLSAAIADLLSGRQRLGFEEVERSLTTFARLRSYLDPSPYAPALDGAFGAVGVALGQ